MFHLAVTMASGLEPLYAMPQGGADRAERSTATSARPDFISKGFLAELKAKAEMGMSASAVVQAHGLNDD